MGANSLQYEHFINKRRSESSNRSMVNLGYPFARLPLTNMLKINQHTTTLSKAFLTASLLGGAAVATLGAGSAQAAGGRYDCAFGDTSMSGFGLCNDVNWSTGWTLSDKKLTNLIFDPAIPVGGPPSGVFSFIWDDFGAPGLSVEDLWTTVAAFNPSLPPPNTGSYSYDLEIIEPWKSQGWTFDTVELDVDSSGTGQKVQKEVKDAVGLTIDTLESMDGVPEGPMPISETFINVTDSWDLNPNTGTVMSISNTYTQTTQTQVVPGPLPILGIGAAFGFSRKLRKRIKGSGAAEMMTTIS
jgi:hypothetical protein